MTITYKTGDILLYHGTRSYVDKFLECAEPSQYSHASMVIVIPNIAFSDTTLPEGVYVIESTQSVHPDAEDHLKKLGVQMTKIEDVLSERGQTIYHRSLKCERDDIFYIKLRAAHLKVHGLPYDLDIGDWINAASRSWCGLLCCCKTQKTDKFWCSALVAYLYVQLGFLPKSTPWTDVSPRDLGTEKGTYLLNFHHCNLADEVLLSIN